MRGMQWLRWTVFVGLLVALTVAPASAKRLGGVVGSEHPVNAPESSGVVDDGSSSGEPAVQAASCPNGQRLLYPSRLADAIPAARRAAGYGANAQIRALSRGDRSGYAPQARRECGTRTVHYSVYVRVHPRGQRCSACDLRAFVVHYRSGRWSVWTGF